MENEVDNKRVNEHVNVAAASAPASARPEPFDPRTEVSADARHIVSNLWMILVNIPLLLFGLWLLWKFVQFVKG